MKIDNQKNVIPFDTSKIAEKKAAAAAKARTDASAPPSDSVDARLSNALKDAVQGIEESGLSPAQVHSQVDEARASGLLRTTQVDTSRPRPSDEELLKMADKVAKDSRSSPEVAAAAFNDLNPSRVSELV